MSLTLRFERFPAPGGLLRVASVPWDSQHFGFPFFQVRCEEVPLDRLAMELASWLSTLPRDRACFVHTTLPASRLSRAGALIANRFYPVETFYEARLELAPFARSCNPKWEGAQLREATEADLPRLRELSGAAFSSLRLHLDTNLSREGADRRMRQWIENSFRAGERVLAYDQRLTGETIGLITYRRTEPTVAYFSLTAIERSRQSAGFVVPMFEAALRDCAEQGYQTATLRISSNNRGSLNLATSLGFRVDNAVMGFHWFRPAPPADTGSFQT